MTPPHATVLLHTFHTRCPHQSPTLYRPNVPLATVAERLLYWRNVRRLRADKAFSEALWEVRLGQYGPAWQRTQGSASPFLVALDKGYYKAEGLDVRVLMESNDKLTLIRRALYGPTLKPTVYHTYARVIQRADELMAARPGLMRVLRVLRALRAWRLWLRLPWPWLRLVPGPPPGSMCPTPTARTCRCSSWTAMRAP